MQLMQVETQIKMSTKISQMACKATRCSQEQKKKKPCGIDKCSFVFLCRHKDTGAAKTNLCDTRNCWKIQWYSERQRREWTHVRNLKPVPELCESSHTPFPTHTESAVRVFASELRPSSLSKKANRRCFRFLGAFKFEHFYYFSWKLLFAFISTPLEIWLTFFYSNTN